MSFSILQAAAEAPGRIAVVFEGEEISFGQLAGRVRSVIAWLADRGVRESADAAPVALVGENTFEVLTLLYALFEIGVPAALVHPRSPEQDRRRWLAEIGVAELLNLSAVDFRSVAPRDAVPLPDDERPLAIVRTSGTGGRPKGVVLSRRAFAAAAAASARNLGWRDDDRWLLSLPVAHVGGLSILTRCLAARRTVVARRLPRFDAGAVARVIEQDRVTLLSLVPTMLARLLDDGFSLPGHLRALLLGGARSPPALLARAADRGWPVLSTYGLTEACSQVATQRYGSVNRGDRGCEPVDGMEVRIAGGAVEIRGRSLMSGYLPAGETPFDADGWLATGDLGRLDAAGRLHIVGRRDDVIVSGGENVDPVAVETALEEHAAITAACVFGVDDADWGQAVAAALVAENPPADEQLAGHLSGRLAVFQLPKRIAYLDRLPWTTLGKVDRRRASSLALPGLRILRPSRSMDNP